MLQPIETIYKGYRFRSRLEARWAVYFDAMEIKFEYEQEGFILSDGTLYLPDFYLPEFGYFVEVKAEEFSKLERMKCELLAKEKPVILLTGIPDPKTYYTKLYEIDGRIFTEGFSFGLEKIYLLAYRLSKSQQEFNDNVEQIILGNTFEFQAIIEKTIRACLKAKQVRFEHGERA